MKNGMKIDEEGVKEYYLNNLLHRVDGPAVELPDGPVASVLYNTTTEYEPILNWTGGSKFWYLHGKLHRGDGPAEEWADGDKAWWLHGKELIHPKEYRTMEEFFYRLNKDEEYSLQWINDINGLISFIKQPTSKQRRLHAMRWKI